MTNWKSRLADALTYLILTAMALIALGPFLWALSTSLKPESQVLSSPPKWIPTEVTLENYERVITSSSVPRSLLNSVIVCLAAVAFTLIVAVPAGYGAARFRFKVRSILLFYILATSMIPGIAVLVHSMLLPLILVYTTHLRA